MLETRLAYPEPESLTCSLYDLFDMSAVTILAPVNDWMLFEFPAYYVPLNERRMSLLFDLTR